MKRNIISIFLCLFLFSSVCFSADVKIGPNKEMLINGKPFFPISVWLQPSRNIELLSSLGIDTYIPSDYDNDAKDYLDKLAAKNSYGFIQIAAYNEELKKHPALMGWMHNDEPDIAGGNPLKAPQTPPEKILADYKFAKSKDPDHPVYVNFGSDQASGRAPVSKKMYLEFAKGADILSFDVYPVNHLGDNSLHIVAKGMDKLASYCDNKKPGWIWLECSKINDKTREGQRAPTPAELKTEIWMVIVHGAKGYGYFPHTWTPSYKACDLSSEVQGAMKKENARVKSFTDVILSADSKREVKCETAGDSKVDVLVKELNGKIYIFAVNMKKLADKAKFSIAGVKDAIADVNDEKRKIDIKGGGFEDNFREYEVHIYEVPIK